MASSDLRSEATRPSLAVLRGLGLTEVALADLVMEAARTGVPAEEIAFARRWVTEARYYRALAERIGLDFVDLRTVRLCFDTPGADDPRVAARRRLVSFEDHTRRRIAVVPSGRDIDRLCESAVGPSAEHVRASLAISSPHIFREALARQAGPRLLSGAVRMLRDRDASLSAVDTPRRVARLAWRLLALLVVAGVLVAVAPEAWAWFGGTCGVAVLLATTGIIALRVASLIARPVALAAPLTAAELPRITVLVAAYREAPVMAQLMQALRALDYPAGKLEVLVLLEADDCETPAALAAAAPPGFVTVLTVPSGIPRTKPRALQYGLAFAQGDLVGVYDAEDVPHPRQLRAVAEAFSAADATLACVQAPLVIEAEGTFLSRHFALEYGALFQVAVPGLAARGLPVMLGGTSNFFHTATLRALGGWDPYNVTEDAELGLRLFRAGLSVGVVALPTREEAPRAWRAWREQRIRWQKGWMQTALAHAWDIRRLVRDRGLLGGATLVAALAGTIGVGLLYPVSWVALALHMADGAAMSRDPVIAGTFWTGVVLFLLGHVIAACMLVRGASVVGRAMDWRDLAGAVAYWWLVSVAAWCAVVDLVRRPFHWAKTDHVGLYSIVRRRAAAWSGPADRSRVDTKRPARSSR